MSLNQEEQTCQQMNQGEVLNASHKEYPLHKVIIYGDKISCAKLSKRLSCAIKHLPIRVHFSYEHDAKKALNPSVTKDPTIVVDSKIFLEGLVQTEEITNAFEKLLTNKQKD